MHNRQGDPVNSASEYVVDRVNNNQSGAKKCNQSDTVLHRFYPVSIWLDYVIDRVTLSAVGVDVLLTGWPCQQWVLMSYWQGHPVSSGWWCIINRVTLSAVGADVLLTGWPCQQWVLMSYWQGHPVSCSGGWCLIDHVDRVVWCVIDRVTLSAVVVDVLFTGWPCQQWVLMCYWQAAVGVHVVGYLLYGW